jgi:competence ComEA-like helix-hairpin-helix protein
MDKRVFEEKTAIQLELNTADSADFIKLSGIGPVFASRIVKYREKLGGFLTKNQLMEIYGMTDTLYQKIDSFLTLNANKIQKINLNSADFKTLINHPYIDYNATNGILKYRDQNGDYESIEDLKLLYSLDEKTIERIKPYLTVHE